MSEETEGLTGREVGSILERLDMIQKTLKDINRVVAQHETTINRMRGAMWIMGAGMPFLLLILTWIMKRL
ncbi:MAG TPA: hypothetical protein VFF86_04150 [Candidatus Methylomirabilis sp.]|nr:hypothetical protein [Candidatus Methylomirabilis sp.]